MSVSIAEVETLLANKLQEQEVKFNTRIELIVKDFQIKLQNQANEYQIKLDDQLKKFKRKSEVQKNDISETSQRIDEALKRIEVAEKDLVVAFNDLEVTKRVAFQTDQYQRRNNLEISGIPDSCDDNLEQVCIDLINTIIDDPKNPLDPEDLIGTFDVEGCHRLQTTNDEGTKNTIIRFTNRKICEEAMENRRFVRDVKIEALKEAKKGIYINDNLCTYYKELSAKARRLFKKDMISKTWIKNGLVKIKLKNNKTRTITHQNDFDKLFPDFVYFDN